MVRVVVTIKMPWKVNDEMNRDKTGKIETRLSYPWHLAITYSAAQWHLSFRTLISFSILTHLNHLAPRLALQKNYCQKEWLWSVVSTIVWFKTIIMQPVFDLPTLPWSIMLKHYYPAWPVMFTDNKTWAMFLAATAWVWNSLPPQTRAATLSLKEGVY